MPTCRSACENYFHACNYDNDLWRCGPSDFFNGYAPESPSLDPVSGNATYLRDYFPGQPFVGNKFTAGGDEIPICTPALKGSAAARLSLSASSLACLLALVAIIISVYI